MGRWDERDERGQHEGFLVGYVPRSWRPAGQATAIGSSRPVAVLQPYRSNTLLREVGMLDADQKHEVHGIYVIGYGCACGWRSPYYELGTPLEWSPCIILGSEALNERLAEKWWRPHVEAELRHPQASS